MSPIVKVTEEEPSLSILHEETLDETTFLDDLEEKETLLELDLTHCRLKHLSDLNLKRFTCLEKLSLRQNLFQSLGHDPPKDHRSLEVEVEVEVEEQEQEENGVWMGVFPTSLKELDLYDNSIVDLSPLHRLTQLEYLDVSFNRIKSIPKNVFQHMPHLKELYLASNRITQIEHLDGLHQLVTLELGANRIKVLDNLTPCVQLQSLWLGKNKLTELNHVSVLTQLRILSVQSNRLTTLVGIEKCVQLTELYVSHNGLTQLLGIEHLTQLRILDVCHNQLPVFPMLPKLTHLEEVWVSKFFFFFFDR
ncbi:hypothetical protein HMI56_002237 [Coelomomyces lativittatus]|nr:hypothetical protein HMI56_002237 [Coelomomyces lativittatus]